MVQKTVHLEWILAGGCGHCWSRWGSTSSLVLVCVCIKEAFQRKAFSPSADLDWMLKCSPSFKVIPASSLMRKHLHGFPFLRACARACAGAGQPQSRWGQEAPGAPAVCSGGRRAAKWVGRATEVWGSSGQGANIFFSLVEVNMGRKRVFLQVRELHLFLIE